MICQFSTFFSVGVSKNGAIMDKTIEKKTITIK